VGRAIAEGLNQNTTDMTTQLMATLSDQVGVELARGLENNTQLIATLLPRLDQNAGHEVAIGLNENSGPGGGGFLQAMVEATSPTLTQVIVNVLNTSPYNMDNFLSTLIQNLNSNTAQAVAQGLNGNPALVENVLNRLDGKVMAAGLNANEDWLTALVGALDAPSLASALNTALGTAGGQAFVTDLLSTLDGGNVAKVLNINPQLTQELMVRGAQNGLGLTLHDLLSDADVGATGGFLTDLIAGLDPDMVSNALNNSRTAYHGAPGLPYGPWTFLDVTWIKVYLIGGFGLISSLAWSRIEGGERYPGGPSPP
jgi:hypothetical protein